MLEQITGGQEVPYVTLSAGDGLALLINNLGGTPTLELYICARRAVSVLESKGVRVVQVFVGSFMTSLEMQVWTLPSKPTLFSHRSSTMSFLQL